MRAAGGRQPFSLGDGAWGIEVTGRDNGFRLADIAAHLRLPRPARLPGRRRPDPAALRGRAWHCELAGTFGKPVIWRSSASAPTSPPTPNAARYYRHVLHNSLLAGATGWIAWNNTDFDLPGQDPYRHHAFEQHFGLTDAHGTPKATLTEMRAFARDAGRRST